MECKTGILKVRWENQLMSNHWIKLASLHENFCCVCNIFPNNVMFLIQYLCESQFDDNVKFKTAINEEDPDKMRLQPIGKDKDGLMYWFQLDQDHNVRVYVEEQDDLDGSSWKCIVR